MRLSAPPLPVLTLFLVVIRGSSVAAQDTGECRAQVLALGNLTTAPSVYPAEGIPAEGDLRPLFFEGLPFRGKPTRVFAWYGAPGGGEAAGKRPAIVLVHGGGGTAYTDWVKRWNEHGFAAISIAVEGQTDERQADGRAWKRHAWAGPARDGIYADSARPLADQWMYHAVADVILADSLVRSFPEVAPGRLETARDYAFAAAVVATGKPWARQTMQGLEDGKATVELECARPVKRALLIHTTDSGYTGQRRWLTSPAERDAAGTRVRVSAAIPPGTHAYFFNLEADDLTVSSELTTIAVGPAAAPGR